MADYKLLINGALSDGSGTIEVINPATEQPFTTVARATATEAEEAIAAAKAAFPGWAATPLTDRARMLVQLADAVRDNAGDLARLLTQEQGKPLAEAQGEVAWTEGYLRYNATLEIEEQVIQDDASGRVVVQRRPLGVVAGIVPWNFPLLMATWKIGPATLAGNTIVLKTAPSTPVTTLALGDLCREIFPPGVVNILADENDIGPLLTSHPDVAKVAFTGSTATGKAIAKNAADALKRVTLELGGNDAAVVLDDVDVPATAQSLFGGAFINAGQVCLAIKRAYVHSSIYDDMCAELARLAEDAVVDDGLKQGTTIGPIQNRMQYEKVRALMEDAAKDGTIIAGGTVPERDGYFISPTIVRDVNNGHRVVDEEQFGPILPVISFDDEDEVITRVNATPYGLGGSVWSSDVDRAAKVAARIDAGSVWVNQHLAIGPHIPMAGAKQSGLGVEQTAEGLHEYTQIHVLNIAR